MRPSRYRDLMSSDLNIALVHDELVRRGGAEHVFEELVRLFPQSDVYALYSSNTPYLTVEGIKYHIHTTFIQHLPMWFRRHPGRILPLLPHATEQLDLSQYDLVISSSSGFAKGVITRASVPHLSYIHTPTRYLWEEAHTVIKNRSWVTRAGGAFLQHYLRIADYAAAQRPNQLIANSRYTQQRIASYYRRPSQVIYPPIDTTYFTPKSNERLWSSQDPFLIVGRLTPLKYFEQAIAVCEKLQLPLVVIGAGHNEHNLRKLAGKHTSFIGKVPDEELRNYYRRARALIQPGVEDFGMTAAEALGCGTPVIAYGAGGVLEIVEHRRHGYLYTEQRTEALAEAMRQFLLIEQDFIPSLLQRQALRFSRIRFQAEILKQVEEALILRNT
ncbi:MAG: glycosyltransferase [Candidatus Andersenbacteria bacterium]